MFQKLKEKLSLYKLQKKFHKDSQNYKLSLLDIEKQYNKKTDYEYEIEKNKIIEMDKKQRKINEQNIKLKYKKITKDEYDKEIATINEEPYIRWEYFKIIDGQLEFKLDWNDYMIKYLKENGYNQHNENDIIMTWAKDILNDIYENDEIGDNDEN